MTQRIKWGEGEVKYQQLTGEYYHNIFSPPYRFTTTMKLCVMLKTNTSVILKKILNDTLQALKSYPP